MVGHNRLALLGLLIKTLCVILCLRLSLRKLVLTFISINFCIPNNCN